MTRSHSTGLSTAGGDSSACRREQMLLRWVVNRGWTEGSCALGSYLLKRGGLEKDGCSVGSGNVFGEDNGCGKNLSALQTKRGRGQ